MKEEKQKTGRRKAGKHKDNDSMEEENEYAKPFTGFKSK